MNSVGSKCNFYQQIALFKHIVFIKSYILHFSFVFFFLIICRFITLHFFIRHVWKTFFALLFGINHLIYKQFSVLNFTKKVFSSTTFSVSTQIFQIKPQPQTINYRENNLSILCSISNPTKLNAMFFIQLLKRPRTTFEIVLSVAVGQTPQIKWDDNALQSRVSVTGNIDSPS